MELAYLSIWIIVALILGEQEAILFHLRPDLGFKYKYIHYYFTVIRAAIGFALIYFIECTWLMVVPSVVVFPIFHDGAYYVVRNKLNPTIYKLKWKAQSTSTTAIFSFKYDARLYWVLVGGMATVWILIAKYF